MHPARAVSREQQVSGIRSRPGFRRQPLITETLACHLMPETCLSFLTPQVRAESICVQSSGPWVPVAEWLAEARCRDRGDLQDVVALGEPAIVARG